MKILHVVKKELNETEKKIIEEQDRSNDVKIIDLRSNKDYDEIIDLVESSERVICW